MKAAVIFIVIGGVLAFGVDSFFLGGLGLLSIGLIYLAFYIWSDGDHYLPYLVLPIFYLTHTCLELFFGLNPFDKIALGIETGVISKFTLLFSILRMIYPILRIILVIGFVKGLMSATKIRSNEKVVKSYMLSQTIFKGKGTMGESSESMVTMFLKNYMGR